MSRPPNYKNDVASRALRWRHQKVMAALAGGTDVGGFDALVLVVTGRLNGNDRLLRASLEAIREREKAAA